jgi:hypothetical protein
VDSIVDASSTEMPHASSESALCVVVISSQLSSGEHSTLILAEEEPELSWSETLKGSKLMTRGWVCQERILSPRILHFAKHQLF